MSTFLPTSEKILRCRLWVLSYPLPPALAFVNIPFNALFCMWVPSYSSYSCKQGEQTLCIKAKKPCNNCLLPSLIYVPLSYHFNFYWYSAFSPQPCIPLGKVVRRSLGPGTAVGSQDPDSKEHRKGGEIHG